MSNSFYVMRLREHIKCGDGVKSVLAGDQLFQIARKRCRIAGDVTDTPRPEFENACDYARLSARTRRVEKKIIELASFFTGAVKPVAGRAIEPRSDVQIYDLSIRKIGSGQILSGRPCGTVIGFDGQN